MAPACSETLPYPRGVRSEGRRIAAMLVGVIIVVAGIGCGSQNVDQSPPRGVWSGAGFFGANAPLLRDYVGRKRALDALARSMSAAGIEWARVVFDQSVEQRVPGAI